MLTGVFFGVCFAPLVKHSFFRENLSVWIGGTRSPTPINFHWCVSPMIPVEPTADHKVPFDLSEEQPVTQADAIATAMNTVDMIESLGGSIDFNENDFFQAKDLVSKSAKTPTHVTSPAQAKAATEILKRFDYQAIADAQQARNFITNKLIELADCGDLKIEIKALELLGKHSDVGIFTERSEITVHHKSSQSLESSIKDRIKRLLNTNVTDVTPIDDLDEQLGTPTLAGKFEVNDNSETLTVDDPLEPAPDGDVIEKDQE